MQKAKLFTRKLTNKVVKPFVQLKFVTQTYSCNFVS